MAPDEQIITQDTRPAAASASKALGVLAAVSAGGLMALRMKQAPLFFLAGAAAAALLSRKRVIPAAQPMQLLPEREPEPPPTRVVNAPPEVEAWLARQIEREQQAPVITLEVVEASPLLEAIPEPEPQITALEALKPEPIDASPSFELPELLKVEPVISWGAFLAEKPSEPDGAGFVVPSVGPEPRHTPEPLILDEVPAPAEASSNASWLLDIEPLPSLDELATDSSSSVAPASPDSSAFMASAPGFAPLFEAPDVPAVPVAEVPAIQPAFIPALFQGAELPDEITVAPVVEQVQEPEPEVSPPVESAIESAMAGLFMPAAASAEPPTLSVEALEVPVSLAAPGEASFDDPLAFLKENPSLVPGGIAPLPPLRPLAPAVVEAEIVVRPRGLAITKVEPKPVPDAPVEFGVVPIEPTEERLVTLEQPFELKTPALPGDPPADKPAFPQPELPPAPVVLPREQKARKTWRSWWRGD